MTWIEEVDSGQYRGEIPELALLDIRLPDTIDGITVGSRLRESPQHNNIAIVLMTAHRLNPQQEAAAIAKAGANLLMYKPLPDMKVFHSTLLGLVSSP
jgi:CheY-like chemotaxis protein